MSVESCYKITDDSDFVMIRLTGILDNQFIPNFEQEMKTFISSPDRNVVINCENLQGFTIKWTRSFLEFQRGLKAANFKMAFILVSQNVKDFLKAEGLDTAFCICPTLPEAVNVFGMQPKKKVDTEFINPFLSATLKVIEVQAGIKAHPGKIFMKKAEDGLVGDVSGIIGIVSEAFRGSVVITFPESTFLKVMGGMLGEEYASLTKDLLDGAGEITNMIFGQAKVVLNEKGYGIKMALPSVISGKDHSLSSISKGPVLIIPFESSAGNFFVQICLSN